LVESDGEFALFEAAVSLGQDEYPEMDVQSVLGEVDQLLARVRRRIAADAGPVHKLRDPQPAFLSRPGFWRQPQ
jgi:regulator of sirC expression with transglutaminase-like and TPR domain